VAAARRPSDLRIAVVAALLSGAPSTLHALYERADPLEAAKAAGTLVLDDNASDRSLLVAGGAMHSALSWGWTFLLVRILPRDRPIGWGVLAGAVIAWFDLLIVGRRFARIRALPLLPQVADHVAFGALVAVQLASRRRSKGDGS
jgi:hypothetical protein